MAEDELVRQRLAAWDSLEFRDHLHMLLGRNGGWRVVSICVYCGNAVGGLLLLFHTIKLKDEEMTTVESTVWTHHYLSIVLGVSCGALWTTATQVRLAASYSFMLLFLRTPCALALTRTYVHNFVLSHA